MSNLLDTTVSGFIDRRDQVATETPAVERRQFTNSHDSLSPAVRELATAIDAYKVRHRRRFITYEEMMNVVESLGYRKS